MPGPPKGYRKGEPSPLRGMGKTAQWLRDHQDYDGHDCLMWPFYIDPIRGYGTMGYEGKMTKPHIFMCKLVHGERPTPEHEAAHSCGNGHAGCVHPKHLSWKTRSENQRDRSEHNRKPLNGKPRLKPQQVLEIRMARDETVTDLAARFNVDRSTITKIRSGELWPTLL